MRKPVMLALLCLLIPSAVFPQDGRVLVETYTRNFERADTFDTKFNVVADAIDAGPAGMGPFFQGVAEYAYKNSTHLLVESRLREMTVLAIGKIREEEYREARVVLWSLFEVTEDMVIRGAVLDALSVVAKGDRRVVSEMVNYLETQNKLFASDSRPNKQVILPLVRALGEIGDPIAFRALLQARILDYSEVISAAVDTAFLSLEGDLKELLIGVIRSGQATEKLAAIVLGLESDEIGDRGKSELAEEGLRAGLAIKGSSLEDKETARQIRSVANSRLKADRWSRATSLVIEHFGTAVLEYDRGIVTIAYLKDAIDSLGAMGTHESAERLTLYLELLNSYREHGRAYDEQIVLAAINNLNRLGDKVAFANLSYAQYLDYSDAVKRSAKGAIDNLKW